MKHIRMCIQSNAEVYLHPEMSLELVNVDGVTKRRVEKDAEFDDDCGVIVERDIVFDDKAGWRVVITSALDTAENVILL